MLLTARMALLDILQLSIAHQDLDSSVKNTNNTKEYKALEFDNYSLLNLLTNIKSNY